MAVGSIPAAFLLVFNWLSVHLLLIETATWFEFVFLTSSIRLVGVRRCENTLRFPRAAGELPRAEALRDLTEAFPPAGQVFSVGRVIAVPRKAAAAMHRTKKMVLYFRGVFGYFLR